MKNCFQLFSKFRKTVEKKNLLHLLLNRRNVTFMYLIACIFIAALVDANLINKYHWEFAGWNGGGCFPYIEFDHHIKGRVYLTSDVAGILRSDDGGDHWRFITKGLNDKVDNLNVPTLAIAPSDSNVLYAGTAGGLFVSKNAGELWEPCDLNKEIFFARPLSYRSIAINRRDPYSICIGTSKGAVFCSKDAGKTWHILGDKKNPFSSDKGITAAIFTDRGDLLVSSVNGIARYSFVDKSWSNPQPGLINVFDMSTSLQTVTGKRQKIYIAAQNTLLSSSDDGKTWSKIYELPGKGIIIRIDIPDYSKAMGLVWEDYWGGYRGGVIVSHNIGKSWQNSDNSMNPDYKSNPTWVWQYIGGRTNSVKFNPFNQSAIFRTDWWAAWRSDNGGITWQEKTLGAPNTCGTQVTVDDQGYVYAAEMDAGLQVSKDGGKSYSSLFPTKSFDNDVSGHVWRVGVFGNGRNIIATSSPWHRNLNQVMLSTNGGKSFEIIRNGLPSFRPRKNTTWPEGLPRALAIDPKDPMTVYLGIDGDDGGGLFVSKDGGRHWAYSSSQPEEKRIYSALVVDPTDSDRIIWGACGHKGGLYLTRNRGKTWEKIPDIKKTCIFDAAISSKGIMYAVGVIEGGTGKKPVFYSSEDHGKSWRLLKDFIGRGGISIASDPRIDKRVAVSVWQATAGSDGKIFLSNDAGISWSDITGDLPDGLGAKSLVFSKNGEYLYISRYAGTIYRMKL